MQNETLRHAQGELEAIRDNFAELYEFAPVGYFTLTADGVIKKLNLTAVTLLGTERKQLLNRYFRALVAHQDQHHWLHFFAHVKAHGAKDSIELSMQRRDGTVFQAQLHCVNPPSTTPTEALQVAMVDVSARADAQAVLTRQTQLLDHTGELAKVGGWEVNLHNMKLTWTKETFRIAEINSDVVPPIEEAINLYAPEARPVIEAAVQAAINNGTPYDLELPFITAKGRHLWIQTQVFAEMQHCKAVRIYVTFQDITERKQTALILQESEQHTKAILDNMLDGVITINANGLIDSFNKAASHIFGYVAEEVLGRNVSILMPEPHKNLHDNYLKQYFDTGEEHILGKQREVTGQHKDGHSFPMSLSTSKILRNGETVFIGLVRDITEQRHANEEINRLAFYDPLTNLPNRRLLFDRLKQAMHTSKRTSQHGALMFLDLDYFKQLNDTLGHDAGDELLQQVAIRLQACVREGDSVARMGGDEFVILLEALSAVPNEAAAQAELIAQKILASLGQAYRLRKNSYVITPSIGIVTFFQQNESMEELLKKADVAMYQAKAAGRNAARFFDYSMQAAAAVRLSLEKSLRRALTEQEFTLHYQLQVNAQGMPIGAEALVRWRHGKHGSVSPTAFIPLAEETGMILPLGQWVLETACEQLVSWAKKANTQQWTMAVNVSALQFSHPDFVKNVDKALLKTGANPHLLKLELTESMLLNDIDDVIVKMFEIKALGVTFALDDFGTGYSSLSYLKRLPLDQLKIDQSFVRDLMTDPNDAVIARTIVALGHSLGIKVMAEGVETLEQRNSLAEMGCDAYQGFYFASPVAITGLRTAVSKMPDILI